MLHRGDMRPPIAFVQITGAHKNPKNLDLIRVPLNADRCISTTVPRTEPEALTLS